MRWADSLLRIVLLFVHGAGLHTIVSLKACMLWAATLHPPLTPPLPFKLHCGTLPIMRLRLSIF